MWVGTLRPQKADALDDAAFEKIRALTRLDVSLSTIDLEIQRGVAQFIFDPAGVADTHVILPQRTRRQTK
jgi:hypothetical protein